MRRLCTLGDPGGVLRAPRGRRSGRFVPGLGWGSLGLS